MLDLNGKILTINQREEEVIGYKMEEFMGKSIFYDFYQGTPKKSIVKLLEMVVSTKVQTTEIEVIRLKAIKS